MKRRKSLWIYAGIVGSFAAIPLVFFFAKRHFAKAEVEKKLAAFSAQGFPTTLEELQESYAYPEGENAAFLYTDAFSKIVITNEQKESIPSLLGQAARKSSPGKIPLETLQAMDEVLAANQAALNLIREGNWIGNCRYPINLRNGAETWLTHLGGFKQACRLLRLEAEARLARSDTKGAYNSILNGFQLAQSLSKEPLLISHLVRWEASQIILFALEQFLNQHPLTTEQIDELTQWLSAAQNPAQIQTALSGGLCMTLHYYRKGAIQTVIEWGAIQPVNRTWETPFGKAPVMLGAIWIDSTSIWDEDCGFMLNTYEKLFSSMELPAPRRREFLALQSEKIRKIKEQSAMAFLLSEMFLPSTVKFLERELRFLASIRTVALSLAIERYRLVGDGQLPTSLEALPTETLETFGTNPYTGERVQYFILENGYRLLSAKQNSAEQESQKGVLDASFTVKR